MNSDEVLSEQHPIGTLMRLLVLLNVRMGDTSLCLSKFRGDTMNDFERLGILRDRKLTEIGNQLLKDICEVPMPKGENA